MQNLSNYQLKSVANQCSQYESSQQGQFTSSTSQEGCSCENCKSYNGKKCEKDLIDEIMSNMQ